MRDEQRDRDVRPVRDVPPELPDFLSDEPPRNNFLDEVGLIEETFETIDENQRKLDARVKHRRQRRKVRVRDPDGGAEVDTAGVAKKLRRRNRPRATGT